VETFAALKLEIDSWRWTGSGTDGGIRVNFPGAALGRMGRV
jgi:hypothetical protein